MACFLVPVAEAVIVTVVTKAIKAKEAKLVPAKTEGVNRETRAPFSRKLKWLTNMLWGGSALLAFEHVWHGEVVPWFPFLTAAGDPAGSTAMLGEMATVGVTMAVLITAVWGAMLLVSRAITKKALASQPTAN